MWQYNDTLYHYGTPGMRWGIRKHQNYDGTKIKKSEDRSYNFEKFGKSKKFNILFVTGLSGSGKSTFASSLSGKKNADHIDLDAYYGENTLGRKTNKNFDAYLENNYPDYKKANHEMFKTDKAQYFQIKDKMMETLVKYSEDMYPKRSVIAEGVEVFNQTVDPKLVKGKCLYIVGTDPSTSATRAIGRMKIAGESNTNIQTFTKKNTEEGRQFISQYIKSYDDLLAFEKDYTSPKTI